MGKEAFWWNKEYSPKMNRIAVSGDGQHVWAVSVDNKLFFRRWEHNWAAVPGLVVDVAVNYDGSTIWGGPQGCGLGMPIVEYPTSALSNLVRLLCSCVGCILCSL